MLPLPCAFLAQALAEKGNAEAMYNLALMYQAGFGTEENPELAYQWYRKAADAGDAGAMRMVGWCIENRYGIQNPALEWYERAADAGDEEAREAAERLFGQSMETGKPEETVSLRQEEEETATAVTDIQ